MVVLWRRRWRCVRRWREEERVGERSGRRLFWLEVARRVWEAGFRTAIFWEFRGGNEDGDGWDLGVEEGLVIEKERVRFIWIMSTM